MQITNCDELKKQFNRANGQISAIGRMMDEGEDYLKIVQQISAARNALSSLAVNLLKEESNKCFDKSSSKDKMKLEQSEQIKTFEELVINFFKLT